MPANQFGIDLGEIATIAQNQQRTNLLTQEVGNKQGEFDYKAKLQNQLAPIREKIAGGDQSALQQYAAIDPDGAEKISKVWEISDKAKRENMAANAEQYGRIASALTDKLSISKDDNERSMILKQFKLGIPEQLRALIPDVYTPQVGTQLELAIKSARSVKDMADEAYGLKKLESDNKNGAEKLAETKSYHNEMLDISRGRESRLNNNGNSSNYVKPTASGVNVMTKEADALVGGTKRLDQFGTVIGQDSGKADQRNFIITRALYLREQDGGKKPEVAYVRDAFTQMKSELAKQGNPAVQQQQKQVTGTKKLGW